MLRKIFIAIVAILCILLSTGSILLFVYGCGEEEPLIIVIGMLLMAVMAVVDILFIVPEEKHNEKDN